MSGLSFDDHELSKGPSGIDDLFGEVFEYELHDDMEHSEKKKDSKKDNHMDIINDVPFTDHPNPSPQKKELERKVSRNIPKKKDTDNLTEKDLSPPTAKKRRGKPPNASKVPEGTPKNIPSRALFLPNPTSHNLPTVGPHTMNVSLPLHVNQMNSGFPLPSLNQIPFLSTKKDSTLLNEQKQNEKPKNVYFKENTEQKKMILPKKLIPNISAEPKKKDLIPEKEITEKKPVIPETEEEKLTREKKLKKIEKKEQKILIAKDIPLLQKEDKLEEKKLQNQEIIIQQIIPESIERSFAVYVSRTETKAQPTREVIEIDEDTNSNSKTSVEKLPEQKDIVIPETQESQNTQEPVSEGIESSIKQPVKENQDKSLGEILTKIIESPLNKPEAPQEETTQKKRGRKKKEESDPEVKEIPKVPSPKVNIEKPVKRRGRPPRVKEVGQEVEEKPKKTKEERQLEIENRAKERQEKKEQKEREKLEKKEKKEKEKLERKQRKEEEKKEEDIDEKRKVKRKKKSKDDPIEQEHQSEEKKQDDNSQTEKTEEVQPTEKVDQSKDVESNVQREENTPTETTENMETPSSPVYRRNETNMEPPLLQITYHNEETFQKPSDPVVGEKKRRGRKPGSKNKSSVVIPGTPEPKETKKTKGKDKQKEETPEKRDLVIEETPVKKQKIDTDGIPEFIIPSEKELEQELDKSVLIDVNFKTPKSKRKGTPKKFVGSSPISSPIIQERMTVLPEQCRVCKQEEAKFIQKSPVGSYLIGSNCHGKPLTQSTEMNHIIIKDPDDWKTIDSFKFEGYDGYLYKLTGDGKLVGSSTFLLSIYDLPSGEEIYRDRTNKKRLEIEVQDNIVALSTHGNYKHFQF